MSPSPGRVHEEVIVTGRINYLLMSALPLISAFLFVSNVHAQSLTVDATAVNAGESVTVTLSGGPGNARDWLALATVGDQDTS